MVIVFEGRDAAGKGGAIKRITEHLVAARRPRRGAAGAVGPRADASWYFQRYVAHLPAAGEIVLFDRSWYNRAGVEKVIGLLHRRRTRAIHASGPPSADADGRRYRRDQVLVHASPITSRRSGSRLAQTDPPSSGSCRRPTSTRGAAGSTTRRPRTRCSPTPTSPRRAGTWSNRTSSATRGSTASRTAHEIPYEHDEQTPIKLPRGQSDNGYVRPPRTSTPTSPTSRRS